MLLFIGPMVTGQDYQLIDASIKNQGPSSAHWFGTDDMGRDLFTRVCVGGRISIYIGLCCTLVMFVIGALLGALAGLKGGLVDDIIMRICEFIGNLPYLIIVVILSMVLGRSMFSLVFCNEPYRVGRNRAYGKRTDPSDQGTGLCAGRQQHLVHQPDVLLSNIFFRIHLELLWLISRCQFRIYFQ